MYICVCQLSAAGHEAILWDLRWFVNERGHAEARDCFTESDAELC